MFAVVAFVAASSNVESLEDAMLEMGAVGTGEMSSMSSTACEIACAACTQVAWLVSPSSPIFSRYEANTVRLRIKVDRLRLGGNTGVGCFTLLCKPAARVAALGKP